MKPSLHASLSLGRRLAKKDEAGRGGLAGRKAVQVFGVSEELFLERNGEPPLPVSLPKRVWGGDVGKGPLSMQPPGENGRVGVNGCEANAVK